MNIVSRLENAIGEAARTRQHVVQFDLSMGDYAELCMVTATRQLPAAIGFSSGLEVFRGIPVHLNEAMTTSMAACDRGAIFLWSAPDVFDMAKPHPQSVLDVH